VSTFTLSNIASPDFFVPPVIATPVSAGFSGSVLGITAHSAKAAFNFP
jgi:hypothetical protein